jgi:NADH-quinone oxidoreductase subunit I
MIFDKAKLLSVFDVTKDAEPMRFSKGPDGSQPATTTQAAQLPS